MLTPHAKGRGPSGSKFFWVPYLLPCGLTSSDQIRHVTYVWERRVSKRTDATIFPKVGPIIRKKIVLDAYTHTVRRTAAEVCLMIKLDERKFLQGDHVPALPKIFAT